MSVSQVNRQLLRSGECSGTHTKSVYISGIHGVLTGRYVLMVLTVNEAVIYLYTSSEIESVQAELFNVV